MAATITAMVILARRPRLLAVLLAAPLAAQQPPELVSGPPAGSVVPPCTVYAPSGPFAGAEFDAGRQGGKAPTALLFVNELTRNTAPMIRALDRFAVQFAWTGLVTHTIRIAADRSEAEAAVERSSNGLQLARPILVSTDGVEGPGGYALNRKAALTLVLAKDGVVVRSVAFTDTGRADEPRLRALLEEVAGAVPTEPKELRAAIEQRLPRDPERLRALAVELAVLLQRPERTDGGARMQGGPRRDGAADGSANGKDGQPAPQRPREGKAPEDEELRALLRRAIQRAADATELDAVFAAVDARVGTDAALRSQAVEMWKLMLSLDYGNDEGKRRARAWLDQHAK